MTKIKTVIESKAFWLGLLTTIAAAAAVFGYNVPVTTILAVMAPIMIAIGGAGWSDVVVAAKNADLENQIKMHLLVNCSVAPEHLNATYKLMMSSNALPPPRAVKSEAGFITTRLMLLIVVAPIVLGITVAQVGCKSKPVENVVTNVIDCAKAELQAVTAGFSIITVVSEVVDVLSGKSIFPVCDKAQDLLECEAEQLIFKYGGDIVACVIDTVPEPAAGSGSGSAAPQASLMVMHKRSLMQRYFLGKTINHSYKKESH